MTVGRLDTEIRLPYRQDQILSDDPRQLDEYIVELLRHLEELNESITNAVNLQVDLSDGSAVYFGTKNKAGEYPEGTWRLLPVGDTLERQKLISSVWTTAGVWEQAI